MIKTLMIKEKEKTSEIGETDRKPVISDFSCPGNPDVENYFRYTKTGSPSSPKGTSTRPCTRGSTY